jgi:hypothetical protein
MENRKIGAIVVLAIAMAMMMTAFSPIAMAEEKEFEESDEEYETELTSLWVDTPPTIDGSLDGDWAWDMNQTYSNNWFEPISTEKDGLIWQFFANDERYLYVGIDVSPDNTSDDDDYLMLGIDLDGDNAWDEYNDTAVEMSAEGFIYGMKGIYGAGGWEKTDQADYKHRVWEVAIDLSTLELTTNDTINLFMFGGGGTFDPDWWYPAENIDGGSFPDDIITAEISMSIEQPTVVVEEEETPANVVYAMYLTMFALLSTIVLMVGFERIWNWGNELYGKGEYWKAVLIVYGLPLLFGALATLQYYYDWVGKWFGI